MEKSQTKPTFSAILAITPDYGIGKDGTVPWRLSRDMTHFREITSNYKVTSNTKNIVIMGRRTWESIPEQFRPLKNRINIVLTSNSDLLKEDRENLFTSASLEEALTLSNQLQAQEKAGTIFLIGGKSVYESGIKDPRCEQVFLTVIDKKIECDTLLCKDLLENFQHAESSQTFVQNDIPFVFQRFVSKYHNSKTFESCFSEYHPENQN